MIRHLLIVDQYEINRVALADILLKATGAQITTAHSGQAALAAIRSRPWDIAVLDLDMRDMTGLQLIDELATRGGVGGVVITSTHPARIVHAAASYALSHGIATLATLEKPINIGRARAIAATLLANLDARLQTGTAASASEASPPLSCEDMREALAANRFEGYLQPQHLTHDGALRGAELLARLRCPDGTVLAPAAFLPAVARAGLLAPFTDYMVERAFRAHIRLAWRRDLLISINIPTEIACLPGWAQQLAERAVADGVDPTRMIIEIIEDGGAGAIPALIGAVTQLRLRGFSCAIDDFGTGDSSLDRLLWVPFNELKIDRSLIAHARQHPHARRILASTIGMARGLGIAVVVEGVECLDDLHTVTDMGGQVTQGFLHAKPMTLENFEAYAARQQDGRAGPGRDQGVPLHSDADAALRDTLAKAAGRQRQSACRTRSKTTALKVPS